MSSTRRRFLQSMAATNRRHSVASAVLRALVTSSASIMHRRTRAGSTDTRRADSSSEPQIRRLLLIAQADATGALPFRIQLGFGRRTWWGIANAGNPKRSLSD